VLLLYFVHSFYSKFIYYLTQYIFYYHKDYSYWNSWYSHHWTSSLPRW